jgi:hypothetical protein
MYLAAAGVGTIGVADHDSVAPLLDQRMSNLRHQGPRHIRQGTAHHPMTA